MTKSELTAEQRRKLDAWGEWVYMTCMQFGTDQSTAFKVAGEFVQGVEHEWLRRARR